MGTAMTISQSVGDSLCQKLRMVGWDRVSARLIVNQVTVQVSAEGPENVVKRLKLLKQAAVNRMAGKPFELPWIAHTRSGPKGIWRRVWRLLESSSYRDKKRALNTLMVYASLMLPKRAGPTATQEKKFLSSVVHTDEELMIRSSRVNRILAPGSSSILMGVKVLRLKLGSLGWRHRVADPPLVWEYLARRDGTEKSAVRKAERQVDSFLQDNLAFHPFPLVQKALGDSWTDYREMVHPWHGDNVPWRDVVPDDQPIGVVGSTQEPGMKFRAFASPSPVLQAALEPLKDSLLRALNVLPWDCTHDQHKGVVAVQKWLSEGKTVHSVDLSDATNNFPLSVQLRVLRALGVTSEELKLLEMVARSPYRKMWGDRQPIRWDVGQPLGAGPSFMAFALGHAAVAITAELQSGIPLGEVGTTFRILGDDIVICDGGVHSAYRDLLQELSCPISEPKCLSSDDVGEFAGKLILREQVFHGFKFKDLNDLSFMDVVRSLGPQAISRSLLSRRQYEYCKKVRELPEPWGLGFNPKGRSFADRYHEALVLAEREEQLRMAIKRVPAERLLTQVSYQREMSQWHYFRSVRRPMDPKPPSRLRDLVEFAIRPTARFITAAPPVRDPRRNPFGLMNRNADRWLATASSVTHHPIGDPNRTAYDMLVDANDRILRLLGEETSHYGATRSDSEEPDI
nr:MAG: RNA-dependent RNA polymerase [Sanya mito-like virus 1]UUW21443.1 MAG: RNA-dependent RNA polymerase [Sanya mito-like virus 1]